MNNKEHFIEYIRENFTIDKDGMLIIENVINWVFLQSMNTDDTISTLEFLLDGIGINRDEIEIFVTV